MEVRIKSEPGLTQTSTCYLVNSENVVKTSASLHHPESNRQYPGVAIASVGPETATRKEQDTENTFVAPQMVQVKVKKEDNSYEQPLVDAREATTEHMKISRETSTRERYNDWESDYSHHSRVSPGPTSHLSSVADGNPMVHSPSTSERCQEYRPKSNTSIDNSFISQSPRSANSSPSVAISSPAKIAHSPSAGQTFSNHPLIVNSYHIEALPLPEDNQDSYMALPRTPGSEDDLIPSQVYQTPSHRSQGSPRTSNMQTSDPVSRMDFVAAHNLRQQQLADGRNQISNPNVADKMRTFPVVNNSSVHPAKSSGVVEEEVLWEQVQRYRDRKKPPHRVQPTLQEETIFMRYSQIRERRMREGRVVHRFASQETNMENLENNHMYNPGEDHGRHSPQCPRVGLLTTNQFQHPPRNNSTDSRVSHDEFTSIRRPSSSSPCSEDSYTGGRSHGTTARSPTSGTDSAVRRCQAVRTGSSPVLQEITSPQSNNCSHSYEHAGACQAPNGVNSPCGERPESQNSPAELNVDVAEEEIGEDSASCSNQNCTSNSGCDKRGVKRTCSHFATSRKKSHAKKHKRLTTQTHFHNTSCKNRFVENCSSSCFGQHRHNYQHNQGIPSEDVHQEDHEIMSPNHSPCEEKPDERPVYGIKESGNYSYHHRGRKYQHAPVDRCYEQDQTGYYSVNSVNNRSRSSKEDFEECLSTGNHVRRASDGQHHLPASKGYQYLSTDKYENTERNGTLKFASDKSRSGHVPTPSVLNSSANNSDQDKFETEIGEHFEAEHELQSNIQSPVSTDSNKGKNLTPKPPPVKARNDDDIVCHVYGLLSLPGLKETKYAVTLGELKRRVGMPECLTRVDMISYVRQAKTSGRILLDTNNIVTSNRSKPSVLSRVCENEAQVLAEGIHKMNMEYLPLKSMARRTVNRYRGRGCEGCPDCRLKLRRRIVDVEITRNMLKDLKETLYDSQDESEMAYFQLASHNFGHKNLMNQIKLFDKYFANLQEILQDE